MSQYNVGNLPILDESLLENYIELFLDKDINFDVVSDQQLEDMNIKNSNNVKNLQNQQLEQFFGTGLLNNSFNDASIMMEGVFDHHSGGRPTERFLSTMIHPAKLAILARFTALGWRICYEFSQDVWSNGLGIKLIGEDVEDINREINLMLTSHFREITFFEKWELATGFAREQGHSLIVLYYKGEYASDIGGTTPEPQSLTNAYAYMKEPAPENTEIAKVEVFNRQDYRISEDDKKGNPIEFEVSIYLGKFSGQPKVAIHHSRCVWLRRMDIERNFEAHSSVEPIYNELLITTNVLKSMGEIAFRWGTGHPVILTRGLNLKQMEVFKRLIGNPVRSSWHVFPSEMVETFDLISQKTGMVDLPGLADKIIDYIVGGTGIPRPILMGEVAGVVTGGEVNERSYFSLLDKEHSNLEPKVLEFFEKDIFIKNLIWNQTFEFDWGIRQTMSEKDQIDIETKKLANMISKHTLLPLNQLLHESGYPPFEEMVDPEYLDYARMMGNSCISFTLFQYRELLEGIITERINQIQKAQEPKTVLGNDGKGKGEGVKWGEGKNAKIKGPQSNQSSKAEKMSMVKNKMGTLMNSIMGEFSIKDLRSNLNLANDTIYKIAEWKT